jgi:tetratricopeptide (TPR) repeat protein
MISFHETLPTDPRALLQHAFSLHQAGNVKDALSLYQQLLVQLPDEPQLVTLIGIAWIQFENLAEGIRMLEKSLHISPNQEVALSNLAFALHKLNRFDEALVCCDRAIALKPDFAAAYNNRVISLNKLKRFEEALVSCDRAIEVQPNYVEAYNNRAVTLEQLKRFDEALISCEQAIALDPNFFDVYNNRTTILIELERFDEALISCDHTIELKPDFEDAHYNRAKILVKLKKIEEALQSCENAIALRENFAEAYLSKGNILYMLGRFEEALRCYEHAIVLKPDFPDAYWNIALNRLTLGQYEIGWKEYEWRWKSFLKDHVRKFPYHSLWLGDSPISGKRILIYPEQGMGDIIQMCRYIPMLKALGAKIIMEVPASLISLMSTIEVDFEIVEMNTKLPVFDVQCPIMSLPLAFKTTVENVPAEVPYLFSDPAKQKVWKELLGIKTWKKLLGIKTRPRIGLVCSGSTTHVDNDKRSVPLHLFKPLFELPFEFHMLQKEIRSDDHTVLEAFPHVQTHQDNLIDFSDTAALIEEMDLVISVDTSVAHLAGALGKPVWVLVSWVPDFRWLLDRTDSPWYPTATVFRQPEMDNWEHVIEDVCQRLKRNYMS